MSRHSKTRGWRFLLLEMIIVFIGVYGAFYLTTLREEEIDRRNQVNYYKTFLLNLEDLQSSAVAIKTEVDSLLAEQESAQPSKIRLVRVIDFTNNMLIVRSGFEAENFTTIGTDYLASLDRGSNLISMIEKRANILEEETRYFLIYGSGRENEFRAWYIEELKTLSGLLSALESTIVNGAVPETNNIIRMIEG